jgi:exosortase
MADLSSKSSTVAAPGGRRSLADLVDAPREADVSATFNRTALVKMGVLAGLMVLLHYRNLDWLAAKWWLDPNWQHGFIIPLFSLYLLYTRRDEIAAARKRAFLPGLVLMVLFILGEMVAVVAVRNFWLRDVCMVGAVFSLVLFLGGPGLIRVTWLPILYLLFALPLPGRLYQMIALPLQNLAAAASVFLMGALGANIQANASAVTLISQAGVERQLTVAEACSGMRLLVAFLALGVATAYLEERPIWQRVVMVLAALPIAIFCNLIRVSITAYMYYIDREELGQDFMHGFTGLVMLVPAFGLLWGLGWVLQRLVVEEEEPEDGDGAPDEGPAAEAASAGGAA